MKTKAFLLFVFFVSFRFSAVSQNVGINTTGNPPNASAILDVDATDKGLLIPRMTTAQRNAIASPALGLFIYNTDCKQLQIWNGSQWTDANNNAANSTPSAPTAGTHIPSQTQIQWNWNTVTGATAYYYNTVNDFGTATNNGINTDYTQTSLTCNTAYTLYIWAVNSCGNSAATTLNQTTSSCGPPPCAVTNNQFLFTAGKLNIGNNYGYSCLQRTDECRFLLSGQTNNWGAGSYDILLVNVNPAGTFQWAKTIGGASSDGGGYLKNTTGGYLLAGQTVTWGSAGKSALFLMKFDATHNVLWSSVAGTNTDDITSTSMDVASDGNVYVGGQIFSPDYKGYIAKFNSTGTHLWSKIIAPNTSAPAPWSDNYQGGVAATSDNGVIITGWSWSYRMTGAATRQGIVVKFNSAGAVEWAKIIGIGSGGLGGFDASSIRPVSSGGNIVAGNSASPTLVKLDASGNLLWAKQTNEGGFPNRIIETTDGGFLIAGSSVFWHPNSKQSRTQWKFDGSGNILWARSDIDISDGHINPWEQDYQPVETDDGYITAGFSHRHTDAYAETQLSLQKFKYDGTTCGSNTVTATVSNITDILINDITTQVQTYLQTPAVVTSNPIITPGAVTPDNWTDCSQ